MFKEPYIGMPININEHCCQTDDDMSIDNFDNIPLDHLPLAMSYVSWQKWKTTYSLEKSLKVGTLFPDLDLPFEGGMHK